MSEIVMEGRTPSSAKAVALLSMVGFMGLLPGRGRPGLHSIER